MRWIVIVCAGLVMTGCGAAKDPTGERLEVADTNARRAYARTEELSSRVSELEARVEALEANSE